MRRILLDQNVPGGVARLLAEHMVENAFDRGWGRLENGRLLSEAERAGFEVLVLTSNRWNWIRAEGDRIRAALITVRPGEVVVVPIARLASGRTPRTGPGSA